MSAAKSKLPKLSGTAKYLLSLRFDGCETVEDLITVLRQLPPGMEINPGWDPGVKPVVARYNDQPEPVLLLEDNDGTFDD